MVCMCGYDRGVVLVWAQAVRANMVARQLFLERLSQKATGG